VYVCVCLVHMPIYMFNACVCTCAGRLQGIKLPKKVYDPAHQAKVRVLSHSLILSYSSLSYSLALLLSYSPLLSHSLALLLSYSPLLSRSLTLSLSYSLLLSYSLTLSLSYSLLLSSLFNCTTVVAAFLPLSSLHFITFTALLVPLYYHYQ